MGKEITVTERFLIPAGLESVWEFTQSELHRPLWSDYCSEPEIIHREPQRLVRFRGCGDLSGCWEFEAADGGTLWTQTHTLALDGLKRLVHPYFKWKLRRATRRAMRHVKEMLAFSNNLSGSLHEDFF